MGKMIFPLKPVACVTKCFVFSWFVVRANDYMVFYSVFSEADFLAGLVS